MPALAVMSALLSCPDSPVLSHIVGKLTFIKLMSERQLTGVGTCFLNYRNVVVSGLAAFGRKKPKADVWDRWRDDSFAPKCSHYKRRPAPPKADIASTRLIWLICSTLPTVRF
jgi:hypothetical protein